MLDSKPAILPRSNNDNNGTIPPLKEATKLLSSFWSKGNVKLDAINVDNCQVVVRTRTTGMVLWQDGTVSENVDGKDLYMTSVYDELELFSQMYVEDATKPAETRPVGFVQSCNAKDRMAKVQWMKLEGNFHVPDRVENVSFYELTPHPLWTLPVHSIVMRILDNVRFCLQINGK